MDGLSKELDANEHSSDDDIADGGHQDKYIPTFHFDNTSMQIKRCSESDSLLDSTDSKDSRTQSCRKCCCIKICVIL